MQLNGLIYTLPKEIKLLIGAFLIVLSVGFFTGLLFVEETSSANPNGIEEQYLGNENDENAEVMHFKKSPQEMLTLVHNHILSMSIIFFLVGVLVSLTKLNRRLKLFLMIEPLTSVILTFGGLYFLWSGMLWMKYIVMLSGILMVLSYSLSVIVVFTQLLKKS
ncbi:hypothetical protein [Gaetbulibacter saemankumensis]|uniref:hypothetical protein n=1 Tax=Gaetbulibacter saemankumensis TaxID=311208 RepID=UPI0003F8467F|nr:hypothetical protein [Gaetbulibacter saemankumensis]